MSVGALLAILAEEDGGDGGGGSAGTPLDYGDLVAYLDAENGVTGNPDVTQWQSQGTSFNFTIPSGNRAPEFVASSQNGLPGIDFREASGGSGVLRRKLENGSSTFDNYFSGSGSQSIAFAGRIDDLVNSFSTQAAIASKGFEDANGWRLFLEPDGSMRFSHRRSNGSVWTLTASGFYSQGDLVLGSVTYDGGNTSGSGSFSLFNGSDFVSTGSVSTGSGGGTGTESNRNLIIGNILDTNDANQNRPFGGPLFGVWFVDPASTVFDQGYFQRWIP